MSETENRASGETPEARDEGSKKAAMDAARSLVDDADKTIDEIRGRGVMGFLNFDVMYVPLIARYVFIAICVLTVVGIAAGVIASFVGIFTGNILGGLLGIVFAIVFPLVGLLFTRMWFELVLVGFKMNEALQDIRVKIGE